MRPRAQQILSRGGARLATLEPAVHRAALRAIPYAVQRRFDAGAAGAVEAVFELQVRDPRGRAPERFALTIADGRCDVRPGAAAQAGATVAIGADDMVRLVSGASGWPELLSSKRLELGGDPFLALRFPILFRLPAHSHT